MSVRWFSRAELGLVAPDQRRIAFRSDPVVGVTVHWTVTASDKSAWRGIQENEMQNQGYGDISYNAGFTDAGEILAGRDIAYVGAHALSHGNLANRVTYGIAYVGNGAPTKAAVDALRTYLYVVILALKLPHPILLLGHQDWKPFGGISTACPGQVEPIVNQLRAFLGS